MVWGCAELEQGSLGPSFLFAGSSGGSLCCVAVLI